MLGCLRHSAFLADRGGQRLLGQLTPTEMVRWERKRDDISTATVHIPTRSAECDVLLGVMAVGRHELVIYRGEERVWEGPITHATFRGERVEIEARDVMHYVYRTAMKAEYNNAYPNIVTCVQRADHIIRQELARKEALDPPVNVLPYLTAWNRTGDARTTAHTLKYASSVFDHVDGLAARAGLDYTVVGRAIHLFDVDTNIGQAPPVGASDFIGEVLITEYGMELATFAAINDGAGHAGTAGGVHPFYGLVEVVHAAYDENTGEPTEEGDEPTVAEMASQAQRVLAGAVPTPLVVRVPDGSTVNPTGSLSMRDLFPGVRIPLLGNLPGRTFSQMQKLDHVRFEETGGSGVAEGVGESITVTMSPQPYV